MKDYYAPLKGTIFNAILGNIIAILVSVLSPLIDNNPFNVGWKNYLDKLPAFFGVTISAILIAWFFCEVKFYIMNKFVGAIVFGVVSSAIVVLVMVAMSINEVNFTPERYTLAFTLFGIFALLFFILYVGSPSRHE